MGPKTMSHAKRMAQVLQMMPLHMNSSVPRMKLILLQCMKSQVLKSSPCVCWSLTEITSAYSPELQTVLGVVRRLCGRQCMGRQCMGRVGVVMDGHVEPM